MRGLLMGSLPNVESWPQVGELALGLGLSAVIGVERELRQKSAGLRTHALVGLGAALFTLVSKYAFTDVLVPRSVVVDPSRVAAQIVTGIGFIGAGLIFVRRGSVLGLTTAASVWVTAAVGAAAGGGLPVLAVCGTAGYLVVVAGLAPLERVLPAAATMGTLRVRYMVGHGTLRSILGCVTEHGFTVSAVSTEPLRRRSETDVGGEVPDASRVVVVLQVKGKGSVAHLALDVGGLPGVESAASGHDDVD